MEKSLEEKLKNFFSQFNEMALKKSEVIIRPDDVPQGVYYIESGYVRMYTSSEDGRELTLNIFKPQTYFSMMWALANIPNTYYFQAMTEARLRRAPREQVEQFLRSQPELLFDLTKRVLIGLDGILTNIEHLLSGQASQRVLAALFLSAKRFGEKKENGKILISLPLTHQDIANLAGITRETTSIEIEKLARKKLVSHQNRLLIINDVEKFEEEILIYKREHSLPYTL